LASLSAIIQAGERSRMRLTSTLLVSVSARICTCMSSVRRPCELLPTPRGSALQSLLASATRLRCAALVKSNSTSTRHRACSIASRLLISSAWGAIVAQTASTPSQRVLRRCAEAATLAPCPSSRTPVRGPCCIAQPEIRSFETTIEQLMLSSETPRVSRLQMKSAHSMSSVAEPHIELV